MFGDCEGVGGVALHPEVEGFDALEEEEGVEGGHGATCVAETLDAGFQDEGEGAEGVGIGEAVIGGVSVGEVGEASGGFPVEVAGVDDDSADRGSMAADVFCGGLDDDVGTVLDGADEGGGGAGVVDDEWEAVLVGDVGEGANVGDVELGVAEGFGVDGAGFGGDGGADGGEVVGVGEAYGDAVLGEGVVEEVVGSAVEGGGGDERGKIV